MTDRFTSRKFLVAIAAALILIFDLNPQAAYVLLAYAGIEGTLDFRK